MKSRRVLSTSFGVVVGIAVAIFAGTHRTNWIPSGVAAQQPVPDGGTGADILSPSDWVPFVAKVRSVSGEGANSHIRMEGLFYRGGDGSDRFESGPPSGPTKTITIHNISANRFYVFEQGRWTSNPMRLPPSGYHPRKRRVDMRGMEESSEMVSGYRVYKYTDRGGIVSLQAPDLNFFALRTSAQGTVQEFYDVQLGEQPADVFSPPLGAKIEERTEVKGIIWTPASPQRH
jgi:hypothetical protein